MQLRKTVNINKNGIKKRNNISQERLKLLSYWWPAILWMGIIYFLSSHQVQPAAQIFWQDFIIKKTAHFIEFSVLSLLYYRAFLFVFEKSKYNPETNFNPVFAAVYLSVLYAIFDETHQSFVPGREPSFRDILIDTFGAISILYLLLNGKNRILIKLKHAVFSNR